MPHPFGNAFDHLKRLLSNTREGPRGIEKSSHNFAFHEPDFPRHHAEKFASEYVKPLTKKRSRRPRTFRTRSSRTASRKPSKHHVLDFPIQYAEQFAREGAESPELSFKELTEKHGLPPEFQIFDKPYSRKKNPTIVIYIDMHGYETKTKLDSEAVNHVISSIDRRGLCSGRENFTPETQTKRITQFREYFSHGLIEGKQAMIDYFRINAGDYSQHPLWKAAHEGEGIPEERAAEWTHFSEEYRRIGSVSFSERILSTDKVFSMSNDFRKENLTRGIFIVDAFNISDEIVRQLKANLSRNPEENLHGMNLINVSTIKRLCKIFRRRFIAMSDKPTTTVDTGVEHFEEISLNRILNFFHDLGFGDVVILDTSCRSGSTAQEYDVERLISDTEKKTRLAFSEAGLTDTPASSRRKSRYFGWMTQRAGGSRKKRSSLK